MRVASERIVLPPGCSWGFYRNSLRQYPFRWHCHREYELTLTVNALGWRYVGDHIGQVEGSDLTLVGPNLPHSWSLEPRTGPGETTIDTYVLWFTPEWVERLADGFEEFAGLHQLFAGGERGLGFSGDATADVVDTVTALAPMPPRQRFAAMLGILDRLLADEPRSLASPAYSGRIDPGRGQRKLDEVLHYVHAHYSDGLTAASTARRFGMSQSTFFRFFRRHMRQNFSDYLSELRVGHACALLLETDDPVYRVAEKSGYPNVSHFHRVFRSRRGVSPSDFRQRFEHTAPTDPLAPAAPDASLAVPIAQNGQS